MGSWVGLTVIKFEIQLKYIWQVRHSSIKAHNLVNPENPNPADTYSYFYSSIPLEYFMNLVLVKCTFPSHYFRSHSLSRANVT